MGRGGNVHVTSKAPQVIRLFNNEMHFYDASAQVILKAVLSSGTCSFRTEGGSDMTSSLANQSMETHIHHLGSSN